MNTPKILKSAITYKFLPILILLLKQTCSTQINFEHIKTCFNQWQSVNFRENFDHLTRALDELHILGTSLFKAEQERETTGQNKLNCYSSKPPENFTANSNIQNFPICNYYEKTKQFLRSKNGKILSCYYFQTCNDASESSKENFAKKWVHKTCETNNFTTKFHFNPNLKYVTKTGNNPSFCQLWPETEYSKISPLPKSVVSESSFYRYWYTEDFYKRFRSNFAWAYICDIHGRLLTIPWNSVEYKHTDNYDVRTRPFWLETVFSRSQLPVRMTFIIDSSSSSHIKYPGLPQDITLYKLFKIISVSIIEKLMGNIKVGVFLTSKDNKLIPIKKPSGRHLFRAPFEGKLDDWQMITSNLSITIEQLIERRSNLNFDYAPKFHSQVLETLLTENMINGIAEEHMIFYFTSTIPDLGNNKIVERMNIQKTNRTKFFSLIFTDDSDTDESLNSYMKIITKKLCGEEGDVPEGFFQGCKSLAFATKISPQNILKYDENVKKYNADRILGSEAFQKIIKQIYKTSHDYDRVHLSTPYRDAFIDDGVMVMTACKIIAENDEFKGMACIDMLQSKLFSKNMLEVENAVFNVTDYIDNRYGGAKLDFEVVFEESVEIMMTQIGTIKISKFGVKIKVLNEICRHDKNLKLDSSLSTFIRLELANKQIKISLWDSRMWKNWSNNQTVICDLPQKINFNTTRIFIKNFNNENYTIFDTDPYEQLTGSASVSDNGISRTCRRLVENVYLNKRLQFLTARETGHLAMYQINVDPEKNEKILRGAPSFSITDSSDDKNSLTFANWVVNETDEQVVYMHYVLPEQDESNKFPMRTDFKTIFSGLTEIEFDGLVKKNAGIENNSTHFNHTYFSPQWRHRKYGSNGFELVSKEISDEIKVLREKVRQYFRLVYIGPLNVNFTLPHENLIAKSAFYGQSSVRWNGKQGNSSELFGVESKDELFNFCEESCSKNSSKFVFQQSGHLLHSDRENVLIGLHITEIGELSSIVNKFKSDKMIIDKNCIILKDQIQNLEYSEFDLKIFEEHGKCNDFKIYGESCLKGGYFVNKKLNLISICQELEESISLRCQAEWSYECLSGNLKSKSNLENFEYEACKGRSCQKSTCRAPCLTSIGNCKDDSDAEIIVPCFSELKFSEKDDDVSTNSKQTKNELGYLFILPVIFYLF